MPYVPNEFTYEHDFDHNGVLFYLGTLGYQLPWQNPASVRKQIQPFASTLACGSASDLAGRQAAMCMTQD